MLPFGVVILFKDGVFVLRAMPLQMPILSTLVALDIRGIGPHSGPRANATHIKCHQCGQYGHLKRHCPENNNTVLKQDDDTKQKNRGRKGKYCSHHGKCGHSTAECRVLNQQNSAGGSGSVPHSAACANCGASGATSGVAPAPAAVNP